MKDVTRTDAGTSHRMRRVRRAAPALAGLLDSLPDPEGGWTQDERNKFFNTFGTVLDFCIPIVSRSQDDGAFLISE